MRSDFAPLAFLFTRTVINGVKRAVSSPKRLIGLLFSSLWIVNLVFKPFQRPPRMPSLTPKGATAFVVPSPETVEAFAFAGFGALSLVYLMGLLSHRGGFRPADVDVLFPTPVSPKMVLTFRMVRDYLLSLLLPIFVALIGFGSTAPSEFGNLLRNAPASLAYLPRVATIGILLLSLFWVTTGYAMSIATERTDLASARNRKIAGWAIAGIVALCVVIVAVHIRMSPDATGFRNAMNNPLLRLLLLPATAATTMVSAPLTGDTTRGLLGGLGLLVCGVLAFRTALAQAEWLYDGAAARGFSGEDMRELAKKGDGIAVLAEQARQGKVKRGRIATRLSRIEVKGGWALVWRELIVQTRAQQALFWLMGGIGLLTSGGFLWALKNSRRFEVVAEPAYLGSLAFLVYIVTMSIAATGFVEFLKKVDVAKPLPFTPTATVFYEILGKLPVSIVTIVPGAIAGFVMAPFAWKTILSSLLAGPAFALTLVSTVMLVSVLFPDFEDPTQRGFRGLMTLIGLLIGLFPIVAVYGLFAIAKWPLWIAALPATAAGLGVSLACSLLAGRLYADFNPSE